MHFQHKLPISWVLIIIQYVSQAKVVSNLETHPAGGSCGPPAQTRSTLLQAGHSLAKAIQCATHSVTDNIQALLAGTRYLAETALV